MKFVSKNLAIKLKKKGFNSPCFGWYYINTPTGMTDGELVLNRYPCRGGTYEETLERHIDFQPKEGFVGYINKNIVDAPTIEQVLKLLRDEKGIHISIMTLISLSKNFMCKQDNHFIFDVRVSWFKEEVFNYYDLDEPYFNYEDACIAGIEYAVDNLI